MFATTLPDRRFLGINDPEVIEYVLKGNSSNYAKGKNFYDQFKPLLGDGIFNVDGNLWKMQRTTASHLFSIKELKYMTDVFVQYAQVVS